MATTPTVFGMRPKDGFLLIAAIALPLIIGYIGSAFTMPNVEGWYDGLVKPALNPPSSVFGPVWTTLYVLMGIASFRVFKARAKAPKLARKALILYGIHLLVNLSWSLVFFGGQDPEGAVAVIVLLLAMIVSLFLLFSRIDRWAGALLVPYFFWVSFATYLNVSIAALN